MAPLVPMFDQLSILVCKLATLSPVMLVLAFRSPICLSRSAIVLVDIPMLLNRALILAVAALSAIPSVTAPLSLPVRLDTAFESALPIKDPAKTSLKVL